MKSFSGYLKQKLGEDYVLLANGGHKALSTFKIGDYLPLAAGSSNPLTNSLYFNDGWRTIMFERTNYGTGSVGGLDGSGLYFQHTLNNVTTYMYLKAGDGLRVGGTLVSLEGHKHSYTDLTGSGTTANQALVSTTTANILQFKQLGDRAFDSTEYVKISGDNMTGSLTLTNSNSTNAYRYIRMQRGASASDMNQFEFTISSNQGQIIYNHIVNGTSDKVGTLRITDTLKFNDYIVYHSGNLPAYLSKDGGTLEGALYIKQNSTATNYKLALTADNEGGNITIYAPDSYKMTKNTSIIRYYQIDAYNGNLRIYTETDGSSWASLNTSGSLSTSVQGTLWGSSNFNPNNYLPLAGGTMTGHITMGGQSIYFGKAGVNAVMSFNSSYPKYGIWYNDANVDQMMFSASNNADDASKADFAINGGGDGVLTSRGNVIWHAGNDGTGSGLDADTVDGYHVGSNGNGQTWGKLAPVGSDGVMEIGKYIDFHNSSNDGVDYAVRLQCQGNNKVAINLPTSAGTLALTSQIPTKASWNYDDRYVASVSISGNYLRINKNGVNTDLTIPYATNANNWGGYSLNRMRFPDWGSTLNHIMPLNLAGLKSFGTPLSTDPEFSNGTDIMAVYNNEVNGAVTITRVVDATAANSSGYVCRIITNGTASPGAGGFHAAIQSRDSAIFLQIFRAKIPVGWQVNTASNSMGSSYSDGWITAQSGTGKWEWYGRLIHCGNSGTFAKGGHVYLTGTSNTSVTWYVSYHQVIDLTKANYDGLRTKYSDYATSAGSATSATNAGSATYAGYLTLTYCSSSTNSGLWNTIKNGSSNATTNKVNFYTIYNNGGPTTYGEMLEILSLNANHWQPQLWFAAGKGGHMYYRNKDYNNDTWGSWLTIIDSGNIGSQSVYYATKAGTATTADIAQLASKDIDENDITSTYLKKSGGYMTGALGWGASTQSILAFASGNTTWLSGLKYSWSGQTTIAFWGKHTNTQFVWHAGVDGTSTDINGYSTRTYDFQVGRNSSGTLQGLIGGNVIWHAGNDGSGSGLDADTVDGYHATDLLRKVTVANNTVNDFNTFANMTLTGRGDPVSGASLANAPWTGTGPAGGYGVLTYLWSGYGTQMAIGYASNRIYIRYKYYSSTTKTSVWQDTWTGLALITDNVASATKLQTSRSLWGQSFNGTADILDKPLERVHQHILFSRESWNYVCVPATNGVLAFNIGVAGTTNTKMCVLNNGNVGIGTTNPSYKLDIVGSIYSTQAGQFGNVRVGGSNMNTVEGNANIEFLKGTGYIDWHYNGNTGDYTTRLIENSSGNLTLYGNLGLSKNPSYKLDVAGDIGCYNVIPISTDTYHLGTENNSWQYIYTKKIMFGSNLNDTWSDGTWTHPWYGINLNSPSSTHTSNNQQDIMAYSLTMSSYWGLALKTQGGAFRMRQDGNIDHNKGITCASLAQTSDVRLKNIQQYANITIDNIAKAPVFLFTWKDQNDNKLRIGTSAQYWKSILPQVVQQQDNQTQTLALDYSTLGTVSSIFLAREVLKLRNQISDLISEVSRLRQLVEEQ